MTTTVKKNGIISTPKSLIRGLGKHQILQLSHRLSHLTMAYWNDSGDCLKGDVAIDIRAHSIRLSELNDVVKNSPFFLPLI